MSRKKDGQNCSLPRPPVLKQKQRLTSQLDESKCPERTPWADSEQPREFADPDLCGKTTNKPRIDKGPPPRQRTCAAWEWPRRPPPNCRPRLRASEAL